jgi:hypothetical protein
MGDGMTDQTPVVRPRIHDLPVAPLAMPTQVLTPEHGLARRLIGYLATRAALLRHSLRRAG